MHPRNLRLYVNAAVATSDDDLKTIAANSDGIMLMNYDEHQTNSDPGPVASQDWFVANLRRVLKMVPKEKLICARGQLRLRLDALHSRPEGSAVIPSPRCSIPRISPSPTPGSAPPTPTPISISTTTPSIRTYEYIDEDANQRHVVWFLDGVSLLNEMRAARAARPADLCPLAAGRGRQLAVEHLGQAQRSGIAAGAGHGAARPRRGHRGRRRHSARHRPARSPASAPSKWTPTSPTRARSSSSTSTWMSIRAPTPIEQYGYHPNEVALSFDDGPDPKWTPQDSRHPQAARTSRAPSCSSAPRPRRTSASCSAIVREGHEIGNHT